MKKLFLTILFTLVLSGGATKSWSIENPIKKILEKGKEISPNNFAGKKDLSNFFTYNSFIVEVDDVEYVYELNGVNFKAFKDTDLAFTGIWRIVGLLKNKVKLSYNNGNTFIVQFDKNFENSVSVNVNTKEKNFYKIRAVPKQQARNERQKKLEKIKEQNRLAKLEEEKRLAKLEEEKRLAKLEEEKRLAKLEEEKLQKNKSKNINVDLEKKDKIIIFLNTTELVNNEKILDVNFSKNYFVSKNGSLDDEELQNYLNSYKKVYIIKKKDFIVNSSPGKKKNISSKYFSGTRSKPNPNFQKISLDIMKLNNLINSLTQEYYQKQRMATQDCQNACNNPYNVGPCYACTGQKAGAAIRIGNINSEIRSAKNKINLLENDLLNTDQIIYEEVSSPYTFVLNEINGLKESQFELFLIDGNDCFKSNVKIIEKKNFNIPSNISNQDTNKNLLSKYDSLDDVKIWEAEKMKNISEDEFLNIANNSIEKIDRKVLYASLNIAEDESFFDKIFSNKKKINKNFKKDKKTNVDNRFKSVVIIETLNSLGSGFFVKPNQVITNFHVVDGAKRITIKNFDGKRSSAKILKIDTRRDLALLETNFRGEPVKFYKSEIYAGLEVEAIGHPNGLDYSLTKGVVSNIRDYSSTYNVTQNANTKFIQTDVAINPGNSGGPLFHQDFVIGVNTQGLTKSKFEGLNFSVHLDELLDFLS